MPADLQWHTHTVCELNCALLGAKVEKEAVAVEVQARVWFWWSVRAQEEGRFFSTMVVRGGVGVDTISM